MFKYIVFPCQMEAIVLCIHLLGFGLALACKWGSFKESFQNANDIYLCLMIPLHELPMQPNSNNTKIVQKRYIKL